MTVKTFVMLQKISISNKCCSIERFIQKNWNSESVNVNVSVNVNKTIVILDVIFGSTAKLQSSTSYKHQERAKQPQNITYLFSESFVLFSVNKEMVCFTRQL